MIEAKKYGEEFFQDMEKGSLKSAREVLPLVKHMIQPSSVIDIGCGTCVWLSVWEKDLGIENYLGVEGPYVDKNLLKVPLEKVLFKDLKEPLGIDKRFDLGMCLEVAEHLPEAKANHLINELTKLSDVILFSAAIPGQGGTYHINEQYPEYWAQIFKKFDYIPIDCIRPAIWKNNSVEFWYKQNILIFIKEDQLYKFPEVEKYKSATFPDYLARIHPDFFDRINEHMRRTKSLFGFFNWKWYLLKKKYLKK